MSNPCDYLCPTHVVICVERLKSFGNYLYVKSNSLMAQARFNAQHTYDFDGGIRVWTISRINKLNGIIWAVKRTYMSVDICELSRKLCPCQHSVTVLQSFQWIKSRVSLNPRILWGHALTINQLIIPSHWQFIQYAFLAQSHDMMSCWVRLLLICHCWRLDTSHCIYQIQIQQWIPQGVSK